MPWYMIVPEVPERPRSSSAPSGPFTLSFPHIVEIADGVVVLYGRDHEATSAGVPRADFDGEFELLPTDFAEILPMPTAMEVFRGLADGLQTRGGACVNRPYRCWHLLFPAEGTEVVCVELTVERWAVYRTTRQHVEQGNALREECQLAHGPMSERAGLLPACATALRRPTAAGS